MEEIMYFQTALVLLSFFHHTLRRVRKPFRILTGWKGDPFLLNSFLCVKINNNEVHIEIHKGERKHTNDGIKKMAAEPGRK